MSKSAEHVILEDDVEVELRKLAERSGRSVDAVANAALREFVRYEHELDALIKRGLGDLDAGRTMTTDTLRARLHVARREREGLSIDGTASSSASTRTRS